MLSSPNSQMVSFFFQVKRFAIPQIALLKTFIYSIFSTEGKDFESLSYIFCSDDYVLKLNRQFLQHNSYTDIVTFNLATSISPVIGECYISIDRVKDNAKLYHTSTYNELLRVIFHGALHLCDYSDKNEQDILTMRSKELFYMQLFLAS